MEDENVSRYKDRPKNPKKGLQTAPEHKRVFEAIRPIWHFCKRAEFSCDGLWLDSLRVTIMHTLFNLFPKGCAQIQTLIVCTNFLESSGLYKQRLNLIVQHLFFYTLNDTCFGLPNSSYFLIYSLIFCRSQGFQVSRIIE